MHKQQFLTIAENFQIYECSNLGNLFSNIRQVEKNTAAWISLIVK